MSATVPPFYCRGFRRFSGLKQVAESYDAIVIGSGVVGASTAFHLARLGGLKVCVVERGAICSGGTARSCAIIRSHYSVATNTALTLKSLAIFADFKAYLGDREAESGFVNSGYLILAPEGALAETLLANLDKQTGVGAQTTAISKPAARDLHPLLNLDDIGTIGYEPNSGYADPYLTTASFLRAARAGGVRIETICKVTRILQAGGRVGGVETERGEIHGSIVIAAIGPWSRQLTDPLGIDLPLEVSRHTVLTFKAAEAYGPTLPVIKDLASADKMYVRPASGGVALVGTGDHGEPIDSADAMDETVGDDFIIHQGGQIAHRMPHFADAAPTASWVGAYDITPDWNPILGPAGDLAGLHIACGFSGHGFKLAPALGRVLAQSALGLDQDVAIGGYGLDRFAAGKLLVGAYGAGSIS